MLHTIWALLEMRKDTLQRNLPAPDEACARHHCLHEGVDELKQLLMVQLMPLLIKLLMQLLQLVMTLA